MDPRNPWTTKMLVQALADKRTYNSVFVRLCGVPLTANQATLILDIAKGLAEPAWRPIETAPTDGKKFDAWAVHPVYGGHGARFTDVQMRGDKSGFGVVIHHQEGTTWEYLEQEGPTYPMWKLTHWMEIPARPVT